MSALSNPAPDVSVVVLATAVEETRRCLAALAAVSGEARTETVVVLGAGSQELRDLVGSAAGVRTIDASVNIGTAAGWNLAFGEARAPRVLLMHEDTEVQPGCIPRLVETAAAHPRAGAVAPRLLRPDGSLQRIGQVLWASCEPAPIDASWPPELLARTTPFAVGMLGGAALLIDRAAWERVGGFDEQLFPFTAVDVDFSVALRAHGCSLLVDPQAVAVHAGMASMRAPGAFGTLRFRHWIWERHRADLLVKWEAFFATQPPRPEEVTPDAVARALHMVGIAPAMAGAPRARRPITGGIDAPLDAEGRVADAVRARAESAEAVVMRDLAADLAEETEAREREIAELWSALQWERARAEELAGRLGERDPISPT